MKTKFVTWCFLTLVLSHTNKTFSKSFHVNRENLTAPFKAITINSATSTPTYWTRLKFDGISGKKKITQVLEPSPNKRELTNFTIITNRKEDKFHSKLSPTGDYVYGSVLLVSCILSLLGNGCAIIIFGFRQRKLIPIEIFFINLAGADILLSVASYPLSIIASFQHKWIFGDLGCSIYAFVCYFLSLSSIFTITAMAFTRYLITCRPAKGNQITCWTCCKMLAICCLFAFIWALLPLLGIGNYEVEPFGLSCTLDWIAKDLASRIYIALVTVFCVLAPFIMLVVCYSKIILLVKHSNTQMKRSELNKRSRKVSGAQLTWISGLISTGFMIAWFPYTIPCLWTSFQGEMVMPIWATPGPCLFAKFSIVYNPIIYVLTVARYRKDFYDLIKCTSCKSDVSESKNIAEAKSATANTGDESTSHNQGQSTNANRID